LKKLLKKLGKKKDWRETLKKYSFRKPKRKVGPSEQVNPISIFYFEEEKQKDDLQREQEAPLHQDKPTQDHIPDKVHILNKKCMKRTNWQVMVANLRGKKVRTHEDDEVRYVFTPIEQSYNSNLKNILLWTSSGGEKRAWANKARRLVSMFEVNGRQPTTTF